MSTCLDITLGGTFTNASALAMAYADLALSSGSLMLWEPGHPSSPQTGTAIPTVPYNQGFSNHAVQFPNVAALPAATLLATQTATTWTLTASANATYQGITFTSLGACPGLHVGDEVWNAAGTVLLGVIAQDRTDTGPYAITPMQTLSSATVIVKRGTKPVIWRWNDNPASGNVEKNFGYEWTPKGGLHIASSRTTMNSTVPESLSPAIPGAVKEYMYANPSHNYFLSAWYNLTTPTASGYSGPQLYLGKNANGGYFFEEMQGSAGTMANLAYAVGARNTAGMIVEQMANSFTGTAMSNAYADFISTLHFGVGAVNGTWGPYGTNKSASAIFYRVYLEDLTVSGRTFAQVTAKDNAAYALAFGSGGRYAGDTYTAPGTLIA